MFLFAFGSLWFALVLWTNSISQGHNSMVLIQEQGSIQDIAIETTSRTHYLFYLCCTRIKYVHAHCKAIAYIAWTRHTTGLESIFHLPSLEITSGMTLPKIVSTFSLRGASISLLIVVVVDLFG